MRVTDVAVEETTRGARIVATVVWDGQRGSESLSLLYRDVGVEAVTTPGDALAAIVLMPAMIRNQDVVIDAPVSRKLHEGIGRTAELWSRWKRYLHRVHVSADLVARTAPTRGAIAACFSAGVDSFYTVLRPREKPISMLLTLREFTASRELLEHADEHLAIVMRAAELLGVPQIVVESNAYDFCANHLGRRRPVRGNVYTGLVLAGAALGLGSLLKRCFIAAGSPRGAEYPTGIHEFVELSSTEMLDIIFDGGGVARDEKVPVIADNEAVLETLIVCPALRSIASNCRRCDKCIEATFLLWHAGTLDRCRTLGPLTPESLRQTIIRPLRFAAFERLRELTEDAAMKAAITSALRRSRARGLLRPAGSALRRVGLR